MQKKFILGLATLVFSTFNSLGCSNRLEWGVSKNNVPYFNTELSNPCVIEIVDDRGRKVEINYDGRGLKTKLYRFDAQSYNFFLNGDYKGTAKLQKNQSNIHYLVSR